MTSAASHLLQKYPEAVQLLGHATAAMLTKSLPDICETADTAAGMLAYGYGPGYKDTICTIILSKKGIKLGFYKGAALADPAHILTGTGKVHRYVEINNGSILHSEAMQDLLQNALNAYRQRKEKK